MTIDRIFDQLNKGDQKTDPALRPLNFDDFVGQKKIKEQLKDKWGEKYDS